MNTLILRNSSGDYTFYKPEAGGQNPNTQARISISSLSVSSWQPRMNVSKRSGRPGGRVTGDRQPDARTIKIGFDVSNLKGNQDSFYYSAINEIIGIFRADRAPYYLVDPDNGRRCEIDLAELNDPWEAGNEMISSKASMTLEMISGEWEDLTATTSASGSGGLTNGGTVTCNNLGQLNAYPIITVTALEDIGTFRITNTTTGVFTEIESFSFLTNNQYIFDSVDGTVYLDDQEAANDLTSGSGLIFLQPGSNTLTYSSPDGDVDVDVEWRVRYAK